MELIILFLLMFFFGLPFYNCYFVLINPKIRRERRREREREKRAFFLKQNNLEEWNGLNASIGNTSVSINCYKKKDKIKIWDCKKFLSIHELDSHLGGTNNIRLYNENVIGTAGKKDQTINLWNLQTGQIVQKIDLSKHAPSKFASEYAYARVVQHIELSKRKPSTYEDADAYAGHFAYIYKYIYDFNFSDNFSDSKKLVTVIWGSSVCGYVRILEIHTGEFLLSMEVSGKIERYFIDDDKIFTIVSTRTTEGSWSSMGDGDYERSCSTYEVTEKFNLQTRKLLESKSKNVRSWTQVRW